MYGNEMTAFRAPRVEGSTPLGFMEINAEDEVDPPVTIAVVQEFCAAVKKSVPPAVFDSFVDVALRLPAAGIPAFVACAHIESVLSDKGQYEVLQQLGMLYPPYGAQLAAAAAKKSREDAERLASSEAASASGSFGAPAPAALAAAPAPAANPIAAFSLPGTPAPAPAGGLFGALAPAPVGVFGMPAPAPPGGLFSCLPGQVMLGVKAPLQDGITEVGRQQFANDKHQPPITFATIPSSVTVIRYGAFQGCRKLTTVIIPSSVKEIEEQAFWNCDSLSSVNIPASVQKIGKKAFCHCGSLTSIDIPFSVTTIGDGAFSDCNGLKTATIPSSATLGKGVFPSGTQVVTMKTVLLPDGKTVLLPAGPAPVANKMIEKPISVFGFTPRVDWNSLAMPVGLHGGGLLGASGATATLPKPPSEPAIVVGARVRVREGVTPSHGWGGVTAQSLGTLVTIAGL